MSNVLIAYDNRIDEATLSPASGWFGSLPITNMQDKIVTKVARTTEDSTEFDITWPKMIPVRVIGFIRHNLRQEVAITVNLYGQNGTNHLGTFNTRWQGRPWPLRDWIDPDFISGEPRDSFRSRHSRITYLDFIKTYSVKRLHVSISSNAASDNGKIQIGRLFAGKAWKPAINFQSGQKIWYENITDKRRSLGGTLYTDLRANYRITQFALSFLTENEALGFALDMQKTIGDSDECLINLDPDNGRYPYAQTLMGRVRQLSPIERIARIDAPYSTAYEIEEIV
jgi:hypothetical protein